MKKITFVMPELGTGGAERMIFNILTMLPPEKFELTLVLFLRKGFLAEKLPPHVGVKVFHRKKLILALPVLWNTLRSNTDYVVSSGYQNAVLSVLAYVSGNSKKLILRETSVVTVAKKNSRFVKLFKTTIPFTYPLCKRIIFQSAYGASEFEQYFYSHFRNVKVLRNFSSPDKNLQQPGRPNSIFLVGTLNSNKNFVAALEAIRKSSTRNFVVEIFGDGPEKENLREFAARHLPEVKVVFHGYVKGMSEHWPRAALHVLTSKSESYPNVVIEAALAGVPSVCLKAPGGLAEMYSLGNWGALVSDENLSERINELIVLDDKGRNQLKQDAIRCFGEQPRAEYAEFFNQLD